MRYVPIVLVSLFLTYLAGVLVFIVFGEVKRTSHCKENKGVYIQGQCVKADVIPYE